MYRNLKVLGEPSMAKLPLTPLEDARGHFEHILNGEGGRVVFGTSPIPHLKVGARKLQVNASTHFFKLCMAAD